MKTTVDIPEEALDEAQRLSGLKGKKAVIMAALDEFIRARRLEGLLAALGHTELDLTYEDIQRGRAGGTSPPTLPVDCRRSSAIQQELQARRRIVSLSRRCSMSRVSSLPRLPCSR
jgi:hypothetical protein